MVSSGYLRLLIFLLAILIPACVSPSPACLMMYSAYKLLWSCIESDTHTAGSLSTPSAYPQPIAMWLSLLSTDGAHALQGAETLMPISFLVFCALSRACLPCFLEPLNPLSIHQPSCPPPSLPSVILPSTSPSFQYPSTSPAITFCWAHLKKSL